MIDEQIVIVHCSRSRECLRAPQANDQCPAVAGNAARLRHTIHNINPYILRPNCLYTTIICLPCNTAITNFSTSQRRIFIWILINYLKKSRTRGFYFRAFIVSMFYYISYCWTAYVFYHWCSTLLFSNMLNLLTAYYVVSKLNFLIINKWIPYFLTASDN